MNLNFLLYKYKKIYAYNENSLNLFLFLRHLNKIQDNDNILI